MRHGRWPQIWPNLFSAAALCIGASRANAVQQDEIAARAQIAAATLQDAVVVDCQLPGRLQQLGGMRTYMTPGVLTRLPAIDCRTRGGEYTVGDLASGTLSLSRWLPLAQQGSLEAEYYVARIYANGIGGVPVDYGQAAVWYQRAADKKYPAAMQELGYLYEQGLGVNQDALHALNLQREASGLGSDLDYAWKLEAAKQESAKLIGALTDQLDSANAALEDLRTQLTQADDQLSQSRDELARDQDRLLDMRSRLASAQRDGAAQSTARIATLQQQLAARELDVADRQETINVLGGTLRTQLAKSQTDTAKLNELLITGQNENEALRARLAQSEQRYLQSQQELSTLRAEYRQEADSLAQRSEELERIRSHGSDTGAAVLAEKQRELDRQQLHVQALEAELAAQRQGTAAASSAANDAAARTHALQVQYETQQQQLQALRAQLAQWQAQSQDTRTAIVRQMSEQLAARAAALDDKQRQIVALQAQTEQQRTALDSERAQRVHDIAVAGDEVERGRAALRSAQQKLAEQRDQLNQLQSEAAVQQIKLVQERESLAQQLAAGQKASEQRVAQLETQIRGLNADLKDKAAQLSAAQTHVDDLKQQLDASKPAPLIAGNISYRMPQATDAGSSGQAALIATVLGMGPARYHALIIGNSNYRYLAPLNTPSSDAQAVKELLQSRYGFDDIKLLLDATNDQIMQAMNGYARSLGDADRLLIYYAGHGGTNIGPPERAYWLGVDADPALPSSWLSAQTVSDAISMIHARHVLLVADSCFSNALTHATTATVVRAFDERGIKIEWQHSARMVLTSGQNEPVVDSSAGATSHSLFAGLFITVLRQNDILLSGEMLAAEVSSRMAEATARLGIKQTPTYRHLQDPNHNYGEFFFVPVASPMQQVAALNP
jgi:hypothetical protein